jgi:lysophospholipase L1-like esterase
MSGLPKYTFEENAQDALEALEELVALCKADGIPLDIVLLPMFLPYAQWGEEYQRSRNESLKIFGDLGIDHVDLYDAMGRAFDAGVGVQESPADRLHPSLEGCRFMLQDVKSRGGWKLLDG